MSELFVRPASRVATRAPVRRAPGERLLARWLERIRTGRLIVFFPSGDRMAFGASGDGPEAIIAIRDTRLIRRLAIGGDIGFAEAFIAGEWDTPDLTAALRLFAANGHELSGVAGRSWLARISNRLCHARRANTRAGSRRNVAAHYDLGNEFYRLWLDDTMTYSAALFDAADEPHEVAQRRKYHHLARLLDLRPGDRLLEIGCGWGGFAEMAAADYGCCVTAVTLSAQQQAYAAERIARAGLADRVDVRFQDYREVGGSFEKVASIEMFEAVGEENWPTFFSILDRRLTPGGRAALQVISIADHAFPVYRRNPDFIQRHMFPGGMLPSPSAFGAAVTAAGLRVTDRLMFGRCYAETLRRWHAAFLANRSTIARLGLGDRFQRTWRYYFAYCEIGFEIGRIDVGHYVVERP